MLWHIPVLLKDEQTLRVRGSFQDPEGLYLVSFDVKVKVKLSLCLTKHHAMKTYWGVKV
jgi:hypothetical protein